MGGFFRTSLRARDTAETAALLSDRYGRVSIESDRVTIREEHFGDGRFTFGRALLAGGLRGSHDIHGDFIVVQPTGGSGTWRIGGDAGAYERTPLLLQPGPPLLSRLEDLREGVLTLDPAVLTSTARALYADDDLVLRFDTDPRPVDARAGAAFREVVELVAATGSSAEDDLVRSALYQLLVVTTLETFRLTGDRRRRRQTASSVLRAHRRAVEFIESHASLPISTVDVARAAEVSLADLRSAFRARCGSTPEQHLRRTRLAAARADLVAADPTRGDTVTAIATRWGFADRSGFARHFRAAYGVNPKHVLDR